MWVLQGQNERQRDQHAHPCHRRQQGGFRILFPRHLLDPFVVLLDARAQLCGLLEQRLDGFAQRSGQILRQAPIDVSGVACPAAARRTTSSVRAPC
jgi:hypothetical protein